MKKKDITVHKTKKTKAKDPHAKTSMVTHKLKITKKKISKKVNHMKHIVKKNVKHQHAKKTAQAKKVKTTKTKKTSAQEKRKSFGKVIIVHGWDSDINKGWHPWLKDTLESQGFDVIMRQMPHSNAPAIDEWVEALNDVSGKIDDKTYFIGHSIGCQTILRTLERHEAPNIGGAIFLAGWFDLMDGAYDKKDKKSQKRIAKPWINTPIDFKRLQSKLNPEKTIAIFSDNDPCVDVNNARIFKEKLGAKIIVENGKGHYDVDVTSIPVIIEELLKMASDLKEYQNIEDKKQKSFDGTIISKE